jgi:hypothetical protein
MRCGPLCGERGRDVRGLFLSRYHSSCLLILLLLLFCTCRWVVCVGTVCRGRVRLTAGGRLQCTAPGGKWKGDVQTRSSETVHLLFCYRTFCAFAILASGGVFGRGPSVLDAGWGNAATCCDAYLALRVGHTDGSVEVGHWLPCFDRAGLRGFFFLPIPRYRRSTLFPAGPAWA